MRHATRTIVTEVKTIITDDGFHHQSALQAKTYLGQQMLKACSKMVDTLTEEINRGVFDISSISDELYRFLQLKTEIEKGVSDEIRL